MRKIKKLDIKDPEKFKKQLLVWGKTQKNFMLLDSNHYARLTKNNASYVYDFIVAGGTLSFVQAREYDGFSTLADYLDKTKDWVFGYFSYDLKNELEELRSENEDNLEFPGLYFFQPEYVFTSKSNKTEVHTLPKYTPSKDRDKVLKEISGFDSELSPEGQFHSLQIQKKFNKSEYLETINKLRQHIKRGDIYEINLCQEFYSNALIDPFFTYQQLSSISPSPFASFLQLNDKYLVSSSPERFLKKTGKRVISQPIKGTSRRGATPEEDIKLKEQLYHDKKERAENVMIVDLVRNDLSRTALPGTVKVDELYGIYSFEQVHQMISTVSCEIEQKDYLACIKNCFPMGSMTGAPKVRAMQLIEDYERTKRGLYSGSVGYFTPDKDFDFNVVIRSILYNSAKKYVSYSVGGAITYLSDPEKEYEECMIKAKAMKNVLNR